jgi:DNA-binding NtrC family response regulator
VQLLGEQPWPGNIRELENAVRKALLLARGYAIGATDIRKALGASPARTAGCSPLAAYIAELLAAASRGDAENVRAGLFENADRELFTQAIKLAQGNQARAARWLGVSRLTMREKLTHFGIHPAQEPPKPS